VGAVVVLVLTAVICFRGIAEQPFYTKESRARQSSSGRWLTAAV
jgi:hypothetical protein